MSTTSPPQQYIHTASIGLDLTHLNLRPAPVASPSPPRAPSEQTTPAETGDVGEEGGTRELQFGEYQNPKKKKRIYKKKLKKNHNGWEDNHVEKPLHEADKDRYAESLPFDQRLLRAQDEWRSFRAIPLDVRINFDYVLRHLGIDVYQLRQKYGRQALRGVQPEETRKKEPLSGGGGSGKPKPAADSDESDDEMEELGPNEEKWAQRALSKESIAKWLEARMNDGYAPTLKWAPTCMGNFLTFLLARNVLPLQKDKLKAAIAICEIAKTEFAPTGIIIRNHYLPTSLGASLKTLFPTCDSTLLSPIPLHLPVEPEKSAPLAPDLITVAGMGEEFDVEGDETKPLENVGSEPSKIVEVDPNEVPLDPKKKVEEIQRMLREEAKRVEGWRMPIQSDKDATRVVRAELERIGINVDAVGYWRVGYQERSARKVMEWKKIEGTDVVLPPKEETKNGGKSEPEQAKSKDAVGWKPKPDLTIKKDVSETKEEDKEVPKKAKGLEEDDEGEEGEGDENGEPTGADLGPPTLYNLELSRHLDDFPLNTRVSHPVADRVFALSDAAVDQTGTGGSLHRPITLIIPDRIAKHLNKGIVFEADYTQILFFESGSSEQKRELWFMTAMYRILPSFYQLLGEDLRDEPDKTRSFNCGWEVPALWEEQVKEFEEKEKELQELRREKEALAVGETGGTSGDLIAE